MKERNCMGNEKKNMTPSKKINHESNCIYFNKNNIN
jgi:hypothetical protein